MGEEELFYRVEVGELAGKYCLEYCLELWLIHITFRWSVRICIFPLFLNPDSHCAFLPQSSPFSTADSSVYSGSLRLSLGRRGPLGAATSKPTSAGMKIFFLLSTKNEGDSFSKALWKGWGEGGGRQLKMKGKGGSFGSEKVKSRLDIVEGFIDHVRGGRMGIVRD